MTPASDMPVGRERLGETRQLGIRLVPFYRRWADVALWFTSSLGGTILLWWLLLAITSRLSFAPSPLLLILLVYAPVGSLIVWTLLGYRRGRVLEVDDYALSLQVGGGRARVLPWEHVTEIRQGLRPYRRKRSDSLRMGYVLVARGRRRRDTVRVGSGYLMASAEEPIGSFAALVEKRARRRGIPVVDIRV